MIGLYRSEIVRVCKLHLANSVSIGNILEEGKIFTAFLRPIYSSPVPSCHKLLPAGNTQIQPCNTSPVSMFEQYEFDKLVPPKRLVRL